MRAIGEMRALINDAGLTFTPTGGTPEAVPVFPVIPKEGLKTPSIALAQLEAAYSNGISTVGWARNVTVRIEMRAIDYVAILGYEQLILQALRASGILMAVEGTDDDYDDEHKLYVRNLVVVVRQR